MGEVFLAQAEGQEMPVVVKRVLPHLAENPRFLRLFLDETRIAARLDHPNIVRIHELGEVKGTWFVAMDFVPGRDLRELLKRAKQQGDEIPFEVVAAVGVGVALGLHAAHSAVDAQGRALKIVHRDVSPHNVLVSDRGEVKLIDFGVAKAANKSVHTATGMLKGKFPYMSPEQSRAKAVDARTDVFALGIVLWEMVTQKYLFRGKSDAETVRMVRAAQVPLLSTLRPDVPPALEAAILKSLRVDPKERFKSAHEFAEALEQIAAALPPANLMRWVGRYDDVELADDAPAWMLDVSDDGSAEGETRDEEATAVTRSLSNAADDSSEGSLHVRPSPLLTKSERPMLSEAKKLETARQILTSVVARPTNITPQATSFVGRVAELADLHQMFRQGFRLLTLLGPGGTGKTRLSLQFGTQLVTYFQADSGQGRRRGGVWFADLTEVRDVDGICTAVAKALGIPLAPGDAVAQMGHAIAARGETLVVLDNFEQLVAFAAATVEKWLRAAPLARFVVSSRELLRVAHESVFEVPPLRVPNEGEPVSTAESVLLFIERARAVRAGWTPTPDEEKSIAEIVRQLDGMPLAIELAAARMSVLGPAQLVSRLPQRFSLLVDKRDVQARQATLRGAIDWSWNMLSPHEASALAQLSVFRGGFSPDAVERVVRVDDAGAIETVSQLRSKSLVRAYYPLGDDTQVRFGLYETIREYAREKLAKLPDEGATRARHSAYYLQLGEALAVDAESNADRLAVLELERDNLTAIVHRAKLVAGPAQESLRALLALDPLLTLKGPFESHVGLLEDVVSRAGSEPRLLAQGLEALGRARQARGQLPDAEAEYRRLLALAVSLRDRDLEGRAYSYLGGVTRGRGDQLQARRHFEHARTLLDAVGNRRMAGRTLSNLGGVLRGLGLETEALDAYNEALEIHRAANDRRYEGITLANLGVQQQALGLLKQARANYQAALSIHRELGNRRSEGISHINLGDLCRDLNQPGQASAHYENALRIVRAVGARRFEGIALISKAALHHEQGAIPEAVACFHEGLAVLREVGDRRHQGLALCGLAATTALQGDVMTAETFMAEATHALAEKEDPLLLVAADVYRAQLELVRAMQTRSRSEAKVLTDRAQKRLADAERAGPADSKHPSGVPSAASRSEHVRAAVRAVRASMPDTQALS